MRNNFKLLEEEEARRYPGAPPEIEQKLKSEMGVMQAFGNILDMYLPKIIKVFVMIAGGNADEIGKNDRARSGSDNSIDRGGAASSILPSDKGPAGPGSPD
ncbi:MAG: hypothetical protein AAFO94_01560 [Bacteroidota bacterium]